MSDSEMTSLGPERDSFSVVATKDSLSLSFMDWKLLTQNSRIIYLTLLFAVFLQIYKFSSAFGKDSRNFISSELIYFVLNLRVFKIPS